jgi:hypothetical protein
LLAIQGLLCFFDGHRTRRVGVRVHYRVYRVCVVYACVNSEFVGMLSRFIFFLANRRCAGREGR